MTNTTSYIFLVLVLHRISQRWNQTGQKFAGAPDIVHDILRPNPWLLWMLVALTYLVLIYRIRNQFAIDLRSGIPMGTTCALILCVPAFAFKLGFTANDAPELLLWLSKDGVEALSRFPLIGGARIVFVTFGVEALWACITASYAPEPKAAKRSKFRAVGERHDGNIRNRSFANSPNAPNAVHGHTGPHNKYPPLPPLHHPT